MFAYLQPFVNPNDTWMQMMTQFASFLVLLAGMLFKLGIAGDDPDSEISNKVAVPAMYFICLFPILVVVYVVYFDIKDLWAEFKKPVEETAEYTRAKAKATFSRGVGKIVVQSRMETMSGTAKHVAETGPAETKVADGESVEVISKHQISAKVSPDLDELEDIEHIESG